MHINRTGVLAVPFRGKNMVLVSLRVFSLTWFTAGAFTLAFRVLNQKDMTGNTCNVLF